MNLSVQQIRKILDAWKKLGSFSEDKFPYLTPAILSKQIGISQSLARLFLSLAEHSTEFQKIYLVHSPFGEHRVVGIFKFRDEIPEMLDPGDYEHDDFPVTPELIEVAYQKRVSGTAI